MNLHNLKIHVALNIACFMKLSPSSSRLLLSCLLFVFPHIGAYSIEIEFCLCEQDGGATTYFYSIEGGTECCSSQAGELGSVYHWELGEGSSWVLVSSESIGGVAAQRACCELGLNPNGHLSQ